METVTSMEMPGSEKVLGGGSGEGRKSFSEDQVPASGSWWR